MVDLPLKWSRLPEQTAQLRISENMVEWSEGGAPAADIVGCSRLMSEDDTGTLARVVDVAHAMCDVADRLVADLGHICEGSEVSAVIEVTALPLSSPARRVIAKDPDLVHRLAGAADEYELAFASPPDASPAIDWFQLFLGDAGFAPPYRAAGDESRGGAFADAAHFAQRFLHFRNCRVLPPKFGVQRR